MLVSHLTLAIPYQPGTTNRTGVRAVGEGLAVHLVGEQHLGPSTTAIGRLRW